MGKEIERKFLVVNDDYKKQSEGIFYKQGYLNDEPARAVRVRIAGDKAMLTIKGKTTGASRIEFEYEIPTEDAEVLLNEISKKPLIEKKRYEILHEAFVWEVDEFFGDNQGLIIAEIELQDENQTFEKPEWIGKEVTYDDRFYNANLFKNPFSNWKDKI